MTDNLEISLYLKSRLLLMINYVGVYAEKRDSHPIPQESVSWLPQCAQVKGVDERSTQ